MTLALLELTETPDGDVLEQLLVITIAEGTSLKSHVRADPVGYVRLFTQIDSALPGVPANLRATLEWAALSSLDQLARCRDSTANHAPDPFRALWHGGHLQELHCQSLVDGFTELLGQPGPIGHHVLIEVNAPSAEGAMSGEHGHEPRYRRLRDCVASHLQHLNEVGLRRQTELGEAVGASVERRENSGPSQKILLDALAQRELLAAQWPSASQVSARLGTRDCGDDQTASRLRRDGRLFGVYVTRPVPSYRYPTWQFCTDGQPVLHLQEILTVLRDFGPFPRESDGLLRTMGWGEAEWFLSPHVLLDGASPAEVLAVDPASVLRAARVEFASGN